MENIDITQALKDAEDSLRDFIWTTLSEAFGEEWPEKCGVSTDRVQKWTQRKEEEAKRQSGGVVEPRLLYYADFYDIQTILKKQWEKFAPALGDWKTMEVFLSELEKLRDPDAHRRELLPHQKQLASGISGEIRTKLIRFRSKQETAEDYFPRIEAIRDSVGNIMLAEKRGMNTIVPKSVLRPGDVIDFVVTATDPLGQALEYMIRLGYKAQSWQSENSFSIRLGDGDIGTGYEVAFMIKSARSYHARGDHDDSAVFFYQVLPKRNVL